MKRWLDGVEPLPTDVLSRADFESFFHVAGRHGPGWTSEVQSGRSSAYATIPRVVQEGVRASILFVHADSDDPATTDDYARFHVFDVGGQLLVRSERERDLALLLRVVRDTSAIVASSRARREEEVRAIVRSMPAIDELAVAALVEAVTHGKLSPEERVGIAAEVARAARDPWGYIEGNREACRDYWVFEPVPDLPVIALLHGLSPRFVLEFDWKEAMADVLPALEACVAETGKTFPTHAFVDRCAAWDRGSRRTAIKELATELRSVGVVVLEVKRRADAHTFLFCTEEAAANRRRWAGAKLKIAPLR